MLLNNTDILSCSLAESNRVLLKELSDEDFELFLADSTWQDTVGRLELLHKSHKPWLSEGKRLFLRSFSLGPFPFPLTSARSLLSLSRRRALEGGTRDSDCLLFPTPTSNECSTSRPAGQTKCEKWFKDKGLIAPGYQLSAEAMALIMGFPPNWFDCLNPTKPQEESGQDISQDEQLSQPKQRSLLEESSISIPCLVKQPKHPEIKGVIKQDLGDRFIIYIPSFDSTVTVSKLLVYPDFSSSVGQIDKNPRKNITPSTNNPRKNTQRKNGEGNGTIYYRMVMKNNGKQYQEAYYHYVENGKKRTKYIPKKLLNRVKEAEQGKLPVSDILVLLGGDRKNPRKSSDTSPVSDILVLLGGDGKNPRNSFSTLSVIVDNNLKTEGNNPRNTSPPSTKGRKQG